MGFIRAAFGKLWTLPPTINRKKLTLKLKFILDIKN